MVAYHSKKKKISASTSPLAIFFLRIVIRDYYMTFSISTLVLARDSHIKPDCEAGGLIWVEG
jgi:hypothetical protein